VTDINNENSPASVLKSLLSGEYPAAEITQPGEGVILTCGRTQQKTQSTVFLLLLWADA
jgi:hypothetical protein